MQQLELLQWPPFSHPCTEQLPVSWGSQFTHGHLVMQPYCINLRRMQLSGVQLQFLTVSPRLQENLFLWLHPLLEVAFAFPVWQMPGLTIKPQLTSTIETGNENIQIGVLENLICQFLSPANVWRREGCHMAAKYNPTCSWKHWKSPEVHNLVSVLLIRVCCRLGVQAEVMGREPESDPIKCKYFLWQTWGLALSSASCTTGPFPAGSVQGKGQELPSHTSFLLTPLEPQQLLSLFALNICTAAAQGWDGGELNLLQLCE